MVGPGSTLGNAWIASAEPFRDGLMRRDHAIPPDDDGIVGVAIQYGENCDGG
jgi:hypothetical protein